MFPGLLSRALGGLFGQLLHTRRTDTPASDWLSHIKVSSSLNAHPTLFMCQCHQLSSGTSSMWWLRELPPLSCADKKVWHVASKDHQIHMLFSWKCKLIKKLFDWPTTIIALRCIFLIFYCPWRRQKCLTQNDNWLRIFVILCVLDCI